MWLQTARWPSQPQELTENPPVSLTPYLLPYFQQLREEFLQSTPQSSQAPAVGGVKVVECTGVLRPCIEVAWVSAEKMLKPVAKTPLCLFTTNPINLAGKEMMSL